MSNILQWCRCPYKQLLPGY